MMSNASTTDNILMIRPANFGLNTETAENNTFQSVDDNIDINTIKNEALKEFDAVVKELKYHDINVLVVEDTKNPVKTDAIFPNNWISTHEGKIIVSYPMWSENRRLELREDIVELLQEKYGFDKRYGFEYLVKDSQFLEGTGSMILDRSNKMIFASLSPRTHIKALEKFAVILGYQKMIFHSWHKGSLIYHTNVMMSVADKYAIVCLDSIHDELESKAVKEKLTQLNKQIIEISISQMEDFCANVIQLQSRIGEKYLVMSDRAYNSFTALQIDNILSFNKIIKMPVPIIEKYGGGGIRCMICEIFL
ncbi:MAG: amidinotransferase [Bacteroidia bacterium]|nr:amidinotransferase [Bacteroidia bacterium]